MPPPTTRLPWSALAGAALAGLTAAAPALAQITFYENDAFGGRSFTTQDAVPDLRRKGFNDRASSAVVRSNRWEICQDAGFQGHCTVLRPGQYPSLSAMGLNDRVSSVRAVGRDARVEDEHYAPPPVVADDYRRRDRERLYEAPVSSARAVFGAPEQRCWMTREEVPAERSETRVPGAVFGAVIGGILGHQIGGGSGRDLATAGGAVAGGVVGSRIGGDRGQATVSREVQRCAAVPGPARPAYWDVTYDFRGRQHRVQLASPPGPTVTVNRDGDPRA
jgi:uncharacterized protein YcfJ